jgi:hypothetical protein
VAESVVSPIVFDPLLETAEPARSVFRRPKFRQREILEGGDPSDGETGDDPEVALVGGEYVEAVVLFGKDDA